MKVLQIVRPGEIELIDLPVPEPGPGQVLVKIEAITTCPHWDMHILGGQQMLPGLALNYPYTPGQPGHEACGEIVAIGSGVHDLQVGQRVCVWRDPGHHLPGCYAEYVVKDAHDVLSIPATGKAEHWAPLELAMCVSAHIMLAGKLDLLAQKRVAVFGLGPAGLLFTQFAAAAGATEVIGIDPLAERRTLALQLGASHAYAPDSAEALALPPRNQPDSIDTAFDCVGHPAPVQRAMDLASKLVVLFAVQRQPYTFQPHHWGRLILAGAQPHTREAAIYARDRIAAGKVTMAPLVTTTLPLSEYLHGVELLRSQQALKVAFLPSGD